MVQTRNLQLQQLQLMTWKEQVRLQVEVVKRRQEVWLTTSVSYSISSITLQNSALLDISRFLYMQCTEVYW